MKTSFSSDLHDKSMSLLSEYKKEKNYFLYVWMLSNIKIVFQEQPPWDKEDEYFMAKEITTLRHSKDFFQLSFFLSRIKIAVPDFYMEYTATDKQEFEKLLQTEKENRNWSNVLRLCSRFAIFDSSLVTISKEDIPYIKEQLHEYKAENLWWDFTMMESFAYMVNDTFAVEITPEDEKNIEQALSGFQEKGEWWPYMRMASWLTIIASTDL